MTAFARINTRQDAEQGATWHVEFDGEPLFHDGEAIEMDFLGLESDAGRRAAAAMVRKMDKKSKGKRKSATMSVQDMIDAAEDSELARAEFYSKLCTGWRGVTYIEDADLDNPDAQPALMEFSRENALKLFSTRVWIMEGVDGFLGDKGNFTREIVNS
ncbi:hypothetical protein [Leisingera methylohalidivorans]|uniref:Uncharacterized protein n=1 Tax=Leisingera methylohalidivorans DSM 14336 TaxID=999552 RepID=V9VW25_9RHOB|nr:hypothetical protein [Leisingera methylohalidivorans]AHD02951.1 hypothetical protein METH_06885 [Leisingera methylohalidivorans DSM 14336]